MDVPHVEIVKKKIGNDAVEALQQLYTSAEGMPPSVPVERFRADYHQWLDVLDDLEYRHSLIERNADGARYLLRSYALPLVEGARPLLEHMQILYQRLRDLYRQHLSESLDINTLILGLDGKGSELLEALYYLAESHNIWSGKSNNFPYGEESFLEISEGVLRSDSIADILAQYYEWHYVNPKKIASTWSLHDGEDEVISVFFAKESKSGFPAWYNELDDTKKSLIREIDTALKYNLSVLPTIGLRTLLDVVMVEKVGDIGSFDKKLKKFEGEGYTTKKESELISSVLDAGNAAAHRAYFPNKDDLTACIDVVKHTMEGVFILFPKIKKLEKNTPKRERK